MNKYNLRLAMTENHQRFANYMNILSENEFLFAKEGKWSAGQQLDHLERSTKALLPVFLIPSSFLKLIFGVSSKPSLSFEELVEKYNLKNNEGIPTSKKYIPSTIHFIQKEKLIQKLLKNVQKINKGIEKFSEEDLDEILLPHPLLGKITFREMIYFTIHHVDHHHFLIDKSIQEGLYI